jgi:uncharacterized protein YidB (DUF937 family)
MGYRTRRPVRSSAREVDLSLLDDLLASVTGQASSGHSMGRQPQPQPAASGMGNIMMALLPVVLAMLANRRRAAAAQADPRAGAGAGAGGLGDLLGALLGGAGGAGTGGLADLLAQFQRAGYGEQADSWVSRGQNQPLPANALEQVFGRGALAEIARHAGLSEADTSRGLSQLLPEVVDHVTPDGQVPDADALLASVQALGRRSGLR